MGVEIPSQGNLGQELNKMCPLSGPHPTPPFPRGKTESGGSHDTQSEGKDTSLRVSQLCRPGSEPLRLTSLAPRCPLPTRPFPPPI